MVLPFSEARWAGNILYTAGQVGLQGDDIVAGGVAAELEQAVANLARILGEAGLGLEHVVDMSVFLTDIADLPAFNAAYIQLIPQPFPTRTTIIVQALPLGAVVEIKAIAHRPA